MSVPAKSLPPLPSINDDSSVRDRTPSAPPTSAGAARARLEEKLKTGRALLATLSAADDRARLLHVAIVRRDESLLDGVLASLGVAKSVPPR
jgi:hypothetical protein